MGNQSNLHGVVFTFLLQCRKLKVLFKFFDQLKQCSNTWSFFNCIDNSLRTCNICDFHCDFNQIKYWFLIEFAKQTKRIIMWTLTIMALERYLPTVNRLLTHSGSYKLYLNQIFHGEVVGEIYFHWS